MEYVETLSREGRTVNSGRTFVSIELAPVARTAVGFAVTTVQQITLRDCMQENPRLAHSAAGAGTAVARALENVVSQPTAPQRPRLTLVKKTALSPVSAPVRALPAPWTERDCVTLALVTCNSCFGSGSHPAYFGGRLTVCNCVLRSVFRACFGKWRDIAENQLASRLGSSTTSRLGRRPAGRHGWFYARPREEYRADFELIARRTLDARHYAVFRLHFLEGLDWRVCCTRLGMDRGNFFHSVYRVEERLGRAYREAAPYALFPVYDYFSIAA